MFKIQIVLLPALLFLSTISKAQSADCYGIASTDTVSLARDEGMIISACEFREDCEVRRGDRVEIKALVVLPYYDLHNMYVMDPKDRCFISSTIEFPANFSEECQIPVRVNEGCEP